VYQWGAQRHLHTSAIILHPLASLSPTCIVITHSHQPHPPSPARVRLILLGPILSRPPHPPSPTLIRPSSRVYPILPLASAHPLLRPPILLSPPILLRPPHPPSPACVRPRCCPILSHLLHHSSLTHVCPIPIVSCPPQCPSPSCVRPTVSAPLSLTPSVWPHHLPPTCVTSAIHIYNLSQSLYLRRLLVVSLYYI
jgi:hypothetical protein